MIFQLSSPWVPVSENNLALRQVCTTGDTSLLNNPSCLHQLDNKEDWGNISFSQEVNKYLQLYPDTQHVDIYLHDLNGCIRGKRITINNLLALEQGAYFPLSVYAMDIDGHVVEQSGLGQSVGEPDRICLPVPNTLRPCARDPHHHAQLLLTMKNLDGSPCSVEPRAILNKIVDKFHALGLYPVVAAELEFYLVEKKCSNTTPCEPTQCFQVDVSAPHTHILEEIEQHARRQQLPLSGIVTEAGSGQYELNFRHSNQVVSACENVLAIKRLTRQVAEKYSYTANFMAKPFTDLAGNGLHFHVSLQNKNGHNIFSESLEDSDSMMKQALSGLLTLMPASMAILAPNVNSFRRLRKRIDQPMFSSWGYNDRSVALRLPCCERINQRIEYRMAGADANPYLVMAMILSGILYGIENPVLYLTEQPNNSETFETIPLFQKEALESLKKSHYLSSLLGHDFLNLWTCCKMDELSKFETTVTNLEYTWRT
jgi:gamma-glutamylputrescine synthase